MYASFKNSPLNGHFNKPRPAEKQPEPTKQKSTAAGEKPAKSPVTFLDLFGTDVFVINASMPVTDEQAKAALNAAHQEAKNYRKQK